MVKPFFMSKNNFLKKITLILVTVNTFFVYCSLLSCTKSDPPPIPKEIVKMFPVKDESSQIVNDLKKEIQIYIDGSSSISGFVNSQGNTVFGKVIRGLRSFYLPEYQVSFFKFGTGDPERLDLNQFWAMSSKRNLFNQTSTRLDLAMSSFLKKRESSSVYLVITDGVQASPFGSDFPAFVDPINKWLGPNNHILHIYAFRSEFDGTIYPEAGGSPFYFRSDPARQLTFRPFYIFAFILDQSLEEKISDFIRGFGMSYNFLNFTDKILKKSNLEFDTRIKMGKGGKNCLRRYSKAKEEKGRMIQYLLWRSKGIGLEQGKLNVNFRLDLTDFGREILQNFDKIRVDVQILRLVREVKIKKTAKKEDEKYSAWIHHPVHDMDRYLPKVENSQLIRGAEAGNLPNLITTLQFPRIPESGWYAYLIHVLPKSDAFQIPAWVGNWSTDRDGTHENANKTLNFENVVSCILNNAPIKRRDFGEFFVAINFR